MSTLAEANANMATNKAVPRCISQLTTTTGVAVTDYSLYTSGFTLIVPSRRGAFRICEACAFVKGVKSVKVSEFDAEEGTWIVIIGY